MHDDFAKYFLIGFFSHEDDGREREREREKEREREPSNFIKRWEE